MSLSTRTAAESRAAAIVPIVSIGEVMGVHASLARVFAENMSRVVRYGCINGLPGFITVESGGLAIGADGIFTPLSE